MTAVFLVLAAASALTTAWVRARRPATGRHARPYGARRTPHQQPRHHHARSTP